MTGILMRAGEKDASGRRFTADALRRMAAKNPKQLVYDEEQGALLIVIAKVGAPRKDDPAGTVGRVEV